MHKIYSALLLLALGQEAFAAQKLVCRASRNNSQVVLTSDNTLSFRFTKASKASPFGIDTGSCSFQDRPLTAEEPSNFVMKIPVGTKITVYGRHLGYFGSSSADFMQNSIVVNPSPAWFSTFMNTENSVEVMVDRVGNNWEVKL